MINYNSFFRKLLFQSNLTYNFQRGARNFSPRPWHTRTHARTHIHTHTYTRTHTVRITPRQTEPTQLTNDPSKNPFGGSPLMVHSERNPFKGPSQNMSFSRIPFKGSRSILQFNDLFQRSLYKNPLNYPFKGILQKILKWIPLDDPFKGPSIRIRVSLTRIHSRRVTWKQFTLQV